MGNGSDSGGVAGARQMPGANGADGADPLTAAIAAVSQPTQVAVVSFDSTLPTGRPVKMLVPKDLTDFEALAMHSIVNDIRDKLQAMRGPQLVLPGAGVRLPPQPS